MRELKLRGYNEATKTMHYFNLKSISSSSPYYPGYWYCDVCKLYIDPSDIKEIMLPIGLKDKYKRDCYQKDIIKRMDALYTVEWHNNLAGWFLKPLSGGWHGLNHSDMALMYEVIGNIYENPELLK